MSTDPHRRGRVNQVDNPVNQQKAPIIGRFPRNRVNPVDNLVNQSVNQLRDQHGRQTAVPRRPRRQSEPLVVMLPKVSPFPRSSPSRRQRPRVQLSPAVLDPVPLILVDGLPDPHRRQEAAEDLHHQTAVPVARASPWSSRCRR